MRGLQGPEVSPMTLGKSIAAEAACRRCRARRSAPLDRLQRVAVGQPPRAIGEPELARQRAATARVGTRLGAVDMLPLAGEQRLHDVAFEIVLDPARLDDGAN